MKSVAVTGVSGYLGTALVRLLDADPSVTRIVGIDVNEPSFTARNFEFYSMDIRSPDLAGVVRDCDAIVHLASVHQGTDDIEDVNVGGTRCVCDAAGRSTVKKLIFASSHSVYGVHADNSFPLTEDSPIRPNAENFYSRSKAEAEQIVSYFAKEHPDVVVTTLRFAWISGPNLPTSHARVVDSKVSVVIAGYDVPFQTVHEDDAAAATAFVLERDVPGTFNVCADGSVSSPDEIFGQRRVVLPLDKAKRFLDKMAAAGLSPPGSQMSLLMYPQVMSNDALRAAGFTPRYPTRETLEAAAESRRRFMSVGRLKVRRRNAAVVGAVAVLAVASALRGRRAKRARG